MTYAADSKEFASAKIFERTRARVASIQADLGERGIRRSMAELMEECVDARFPVDHKPSASVPQEILDAFVRYLTEPKDEPDRLFAQALLCRLKDYR